MICETGNLFSLVGKWKSPKRSKEMCGLPDALYHIYMSYICITFALFLSNDQPTNIVLKFVSKVDIRQDRTGNESCTILWACSGYGLRFVQLLIERHVGQGMEWWELLWSTCKLPVDCHPSWWRSWQTLENFEWVIPCTIQWLQLPQQPRYHKKYHNYLQQANLVLVVFNSMGLLANLFPFNKLEWA